jgi:hypothetical protein
MWKFEGDATNETKTIYVMTIIKYLEWGRQDMYVEFWRTNPLEDWDGNWKITWRWVIKMGRCWKWIRVVSD